MHNATTPSRTSSNPVFHLSQPLYKYNHQYIRIKQQKYHKQQQHYNKNKHQKLQTLKSKSKYKHNNKYKSKSKSKEGSISTSKVNQPYLKNKENIEQYAIFQIKKPKSGFYAMKGCRFFEGQAVGKCQQQGRPVKSGDGGSGSTFFNYFMKKYIQSNKHSILQQNEKIPASQHHRLPLIRQSQPYIYPSSITQQLHLQSPSPKSRPQHKSVCLYKKPTLSTHQVGSVSTHSTSINLDMKMKDKKMGTNIHIKQYIAKQKQRNMRHRLKTEPICTSVSTPVCVSVGNIVRVEQIEPESSILQNKRVKNCRDKTTNLKQQQYIHI